MPAFGNLKNALVPFWARFSSDVNLGENQVVALFCTERESSQSFPLSYPELNSTTASPWQPEAGQ